MDIITGIAANGIKDIFFNTNFKYKQQKFVIKLLD